MWSLEWSFFVESGVEFCVESEWSFGVESGVHFQSSVIGIYINNFSTCNFVYVH